MKNIVVILLLIVFSNCKTTDMSVNKKYLYMDLGYSYLNKEMYPESLEALLNAEKIDDKDPSLQNSLGLAYMGLKKYDKAIQRFSRGLILDSTYTESLNNRGVAYLRVGDLNNAIEDFNKALLDDLYVNKSNVYSNLGVANFNQKKYKKSISFYQKAIALNKFHCTARKNLAQAYLKIAMANLAVQEMEEAAHKYCRKDDEVVYWMGLAYMKNKRFISAKKQFEFIIEHFPETFFAKKSKTHLATIEIERNEWND